MLIRRDYLENKQKRLLTNRKILSGILRKRNEPDTDYEKLAQALTENSRQLKEIKTGLLVLKHIEKWQ